MSDGIRMTDGQRSAAIERVGENLALRSGAGCGKTLVLARRFAELLSGSEETENPFANFVALTFTDKAALEMSQRVGKMLAESAAASKGAHRRRLLDWLQQLPEARISTIHSFCASLLRSFAVEAGADPNFTVCADEFLAREMIAEATEQAVLKGVEAKREDVAQLLTNIRYAQVVEQVRSLVEMRTNVPFEDYLDPDATLARWRRIAEAQRREGRSRLADDQKIRREITGIQAIRCTDPSDKLGQYRDEQLRVIAEILEGPEVLTAERFDRLNPTPGGIGAAGAWGGKEQVKRTRDRIKALVSAVTEYRIYTETFGDLDERAAKTLGALTKLALDANTIYTDQKRRRGLLDFADLLICTHKLLIGQPEVRAILSKQIDQLLLDEAQDTDALQVALLERLIFGGENLQELTDGRLFVVGDAKQSIYRFRGAQVEVFEDLCRRLGPEKQENLDVSFRVHAGGAGFINHLFAPLMGEKYDPIRPHREEIPPHPSVEILLADSADEQPIQNAASASKLQGAATAERIRQMIDAEERMVWEKDRQAWRPVQPGDIAILFARMTSSLDYERELSKREIPYYVVAGTGFFNQQEVFDVLNALRVIDNPFNDIALFGVLRSSVFGLDDNALMHIAESCEKPYFYALQEADLSDRLGEGEHETLRFALDLLGRLHREKDAVGIDRLIQKLLDTTGYEGVLLSQFHGRRMLGNVRMLLDRARDATEESATLGDFIARMDELTISESRYEQAAVAAEAENVVRLMTIHKAKGLEFPVVFVPDLNAGRRGWGKVLLNRLEWGLTYKYKSDGSNANGETDGPDLPLSFRLAKRLEDADQQKEDIRKLYVAATRHKDHLVFVGANWRTKDGNFKDGENYLRKMDEVLAIRNAVDEPRQEIPYAGGKYVASVRKLVPSAPSDTARKKTSGALLLTTATSGADLGRRIEKAAPTSPSPPLVGPLPPEIGEAELAVTALSEFERCPMLYYWRHELRVPEIRTAQDLDAAGEKLPGSPVGVAGSDAATLGTLYHRCMELLDFAHPQEPGPLVRQVAAEIDLDDSIKLEPIAEELAAMLEAFRSHELHRKLRDARKMYRELYFVMDFAPTRLRGQIDLLYQGAGGEWGIVDYKSDRTSLEDVEEHATRYDLQMLLYAAAATKHLSGPGGRPIDATLYFLRPAVTHTFEISPKMLEGLSSRVEKLTRALITSRRTGRFARSENPICPVCPYHTLCRREV